jgi:hypothetical protein
MSRYKSIRASFVHGVSSYADTGIAPLLPNAIERCVINFTPGAKYPGRILNIHRELIIDKINP